MKCKLELRQQDARASRRDDRPLRYGPIWRRRFANCGRFWAVLAHGGVVLLFAVLVAGCGNPAGSHSNLSVRVDGSSTVYPISAAVAEAFDDERRAAELPPIRVPSGFSGTGGGFKRFAAGEIDICDASREIKPSEAEACRKAGIEYVVFSIAYDGIAIVVHPECDWTDRLTVAQLKELWQPDSGVQRWSDLDPSWPEEKIQLLGPGTDSGTFDYFTTAINGEAGSSRSDFTPSEDDNVIVQGVAGDRYALGYFGYAYYAENKDRLKVLAVDDGDGAVTPSPETIRNGTYHPLSRPLYIYVNRAALARAEVADFVMFYLSHAAELAEQVGYVSVDEATAAENQRLLTEATRPAADSPAEPTAAPPAGEAPAEQDANEPTPDDADEAKSASAPSVGDVPLHVGLDQSPRPLARHAQRG